MGRKHKPDRRGKTKDRSKRSGKKQLIVSRGQQYAKMRLHMKGLTQRQVDLKRRMDVHHAKRKKNARDMDVAMEAMIEATSKSTEVFEELVEVLPKKV